MKKKSKANLSKKLKKQKKIKPSVSKTVTTKIEPSSPVFPIVGVGASAGGLEAFMELFRDLPPDTGMSFVLIQHLSPQHPSLLTSLVQKGTSMNVQEAEDQMKVKPNQVYIIPPNHTLEIFHGVLQLTPLTEEQSNILPINLFLTSLARDQGNLAIGIILTGTGSDGAEGLRNIEADGGITFVQEPTTAKFDGMPKAAILATSPGFILHVKDISRELVRIAAHPFIKRALTIEESEPTPETEKVLQKIFLLVRTITKIDFSTYKYPTMIRRIKRRMVLHRIESLNQYFTFLQTSPHEVKSLLDDLLINVTNFFRDIEVFDSLKANVIPQFMKDKAQGTPIRIWSPGCSTGEEVYSIAICLIECLGDSFHKFPIQIYGTDICEPAIKIARLGSYPESASRNISPERLDRFFIKENGRYRITKAVRDCCIFSIQDVTSNPPINRLDLLSCRNLMIYLDPTIQKKLMETFYYALNPNGFLMLGSSESVGSSANLFAVIDKKYKLFLKKSIPQYSVKIVSQEPLKNPVERLSKNPGIISFKQLTKITDPVTLAEQMMLAKYSPAWVLVNQALDIVQFRGATDYYIAPASGLPTWNLIKMLRDGLAPSIRVLIHSALKEIKPVRKNGLKVNSKAIPRVVDVEVIPLMTAAEDFYFLIVFIESKDTKKLLSKEKVQKRKSNEKDPILLENASLKEELALTHKSLQSIVEDQTATSEEMQSTNEEVLSANEELQSTNEELETAKEELQSTNEELTTLNDELTNRNNELDHLSNDLINVLSNANVSIVMVGSDLRIRRFTPMAEKLLNLIPTDVGRILTEINFGFNISKLEERVASVIRTMDTFEAETQDRQGLWYSIRIRPYKTIDNKIDGAVIVFVNINDVKLKQNLIEDAKRYSEGVIQTVRDPLVVLDKDLRIERANQAFYDTFKVTEQETIGHTFYEIGNQQWDIPRLKTLLEDVLPSKSEIRNFEVNHKFEQIGDKIIILNARTLEWEGQRKHLILIGLHDLTEREQKRSRLKKEQ